jgi:hypothetical protein
VSNSCIIHSTQIFPKFPIPNLESKVVKNFYLEIVVIDDDFAGGKRNL